MKKIVYISLIWLLGISCQSSSDLYSDIASIASLRDGLSYTNSTLITKSIVIQGVVTANDKYDEFYYSLIIEDDSGAIKILCQADNIYQYYPFGTRVNVSCSGLYIKNTYGSLSLGAAPTGDYTLDYIDQSSLGQYIKIEEQSSEPYPAKSLRISELTPLHSLQYIELSEIKISNEESIATFCQRDTLTGRTVDTTHIITDSDGASIELRVEQACRYADNELPTTQGSIKAIINYYDGQYSATITNMEYHFQ